MPTNTAMSDQEFTRQSQIDPMHLIPDTDPSILLGTTVPSALDAGVIRDTDASLTRRAFVSRLGTASLSLAGALTGGMLGMGAEKSAFAQQPSTDVKPSTVVASRPQGGNGLIMRQREPENLEFAFSSLDSFITPTDRFYVRSHFATPKLDGATWQLRIEGAVRQPLTLSLADLTAMASRHIQTTMECAGNGRVALSPPARGVQWEQGAVSTTEWTGVPLSALLARAGLHPDAVEVVLEGADMGEIKDPPRPAGPIHFARSLPLSKAQQQDVLIAYKMNGSDIPVSHGYPVRAIVPGWYGMASVKWLTRILVVAKPYQGYFQTVDYAFWQKQDGLPTRVPITAMLVKSSIARPTFREIIPAGGTYRIYGAAWAGESAVTKVEVSTDGGQTWETARLQNLPVPYLWRFWDYTWKVPVRAGRYALLVRATDARGNTQPLVRDPDRDHYMINHLMPVEVDVQ